MSCIGAGAPLAAPPSPRPGALQEISADLQRVVVMPFFICIVWGGPNWPGTPPY